MEVASGARIEARNVCTTDGCLQAVETTVSTAQRKSDCSKFQTPTYLPPTVSVTSTSTRTYTPSTTVTVTSTIYSVITTAKSTAAPTSTAATVSILHPIGGPIGPAPIGTPIAQKRQVAASDLGAVEILAAPPHDHGINPVPLELDDAVQFATLAARGVATATVPAYASACYGASGYASACSCYGIPTGSTVTAATPTKTITSTVTQTASTTSTATHTATTTLGVCDPAKNYGFTQVGGTTNADDSPIIGDVTVVTFPNIDRRKPCCVQCFETVGCYNYFFTTDNEGATVCGLTVLDDPSLGPLVANTTVSATCPNGPVLSQNISGKGFGFGPCESAGTF
ncbi:hypothetical protein MMC06_004761 [Schaereria dolodes]|nr:hypothetical protein [Schaereria dolodes]